MQLNRFPEDGSSPRALVEGLVAAAWMVGAFGNCRDASPVCMTIAG